MPAVTHKAPAVSTDRARPEEQVRRLQNIADDIDERWRLRNYDEGCFDEIAIRALEELRAPETIDPFAPLKWVIESPTLILPDLHDSFGEPPVRVAERNRFFIEVLYWIDGTVSVHQHGFAGAFQVLTGSSIHTQYEFERTEAINSSCAIGRVSARSSELLRTGDIRPIRAGSSMIHSLFHLDRPSATIVVRTFAVADRQPQLSYLPPAIAFDPFRRDRLLAKQVAALKTMYDVRHPDLAKTACELAARADFESLLRALLWISQWSSNDAFVSQMVAAARASHGARIDYLAASLAEQRRLRLILHWRERVHDPELRYLLALLLNVPDRRDILRMVAERSGAEPTAQIVRWFRQLCQSDQSGKLTPLDDGTAQILESLLRGRSSQQIVEELRAEFGDDDIEAQREKIAEAVDLFRSSELLRPLIPAADQV